MTEWVSLDWIDTCGASASAALPTNASDGMPDCQRAVKAMDAIKHRKTAKNRLAILGINFRSN